MWDEAGAVFTDVTNFMANLFLFVSAILEKKSREKKGEDATEPGFCSEKIGQKVLI